MPDLISFDQTADPPLGLDAPLADDWRDAPFVEPTRALFRHVRDRAFEPLANLCDDDFGIVDLDPRGQNVAVDTRAGWEAWFRRLFGEMEATGAETDTEITRYQALADPGGSLGYAVVYFTQLYTLGGQTGRFRCVVTIVWKRTGEADQPWRESRWHVSLLGADVPEGFAT